MQKRDIRVGGIYAVTSSNYGRAGQKAGDKALVRAKVTGFFRPRGSVELVMVTYLDDENRYGNILPAGRTGSLSTRNVVATWAAHEPARAEQQKIRDEHERQMQQAAQERDEAIAEIRALLPADLVPLAWKPERHYLPPSTSVPAGDLLAMLKHVQR